jgi:hypothetical protein
MTGKKCVNFLNGSRLGKGRSIAFAGTVESANGATIEDKMDAPAICFLANDIPLFHNKARVGGEREHAITKDRIVPGEAKNSSLQVGGKRNSLKQLRLPVEGAEKVGREFREGRVIFHNKKSHNLPVCRHRALNRHKVDRRVCGGTGAQPPWTIEERISAVCEIAARDWVLALHLAMQLAMRGEGVQGSKR